jgi:hypothetical protein
VRRRRPGPLRFSLASALLGTILFGAAGSAACSRSKRPPPARPAPAKLAPGGSPGRTAEASAQALCGAIHATANRRRAECCAEAPLSLFYDECVRLLSRAVREHRLDIDPEKVARCAAKVDERTRGCDWIAPNLAAAPAECASAVSGRVAEGGTCSSSLECSENLHCAGQGATTPGVCKPPQAAGASCGTSIDPLAGYLLLRAVEEQKPACVEHCALATHRCEPEPALGSPCKASVNCAKDQTCDQGRCVTRAAPATLSRPGETCESDLDCAAGGCVTQAGRERRCARKCATDLGLLRRK